MTTATIKTSVTTNEYHQQQKLREHQTGSVVSLMRTSIDNNNNNFISIMGEIKLRQCKGMEVFSLRLSRFRGPGS